MSVPVVILLAGAAIVGGAWAWLAVRFVKNARRDYFAAQALAAMLANPNKEGNNRGAGGLKRFPVYAYEYADAMMKARQA